MAKSVVPEVVSLSDSLLSLGKPSPHWSVTRFLPWMTRKNNFRICLLVCCDGFKADATCI